MKNWSAHMLTGIEKMTRKMRVGATCRTESSGPACRRGEACGAWRVAGFTVVALMLMVFGLVENSMAASSATGSCTITTLGADELVTCTGDGTFTPDQDLSNVQVLVLAGGGGGGGTPANTQRYRSAGGGGAGGYLYSATNAMTTGTTYNIVVGAGGAGGAAGGATPGGSGGDTSISGAGFTTITAIGGGGGSHFDGVDGGSGGAGGRNGNNSFGAAGVGVGGQGNDAGLASNVNAGGGGGAGAAGNAENGGAGISSSITGAAVEYACGGSGSTNTPSAGTPGCSSAGSAPATTGNGTSASPNLGGGGGGATEDSTNTQYTGGDGGSGVVIIRYTPILCAAGTPTGLSGSDAAGNPVEVDLSWTDGANNDYVNVYRDGLLIASNITTGTYNDTSVTSSTTYNYTVRGYNVAETCESGDSTAAIVTTNPCSESTQSSIIWNGTNTAAGDFDPSSFATLTDIGTAEYKVTEGGGVGTISNINQWTDRSDGSNAALAAGTDRLMVVAADFEYGADPGQVIVTATCNGKTFTPLVNANGREYVWIGYLNDADAAVCAGNPITVDFADGTDTGGPAHGFWQASFAGVEQTNPLVDSQFSYNAGATTRSFTNLNVEAGGWAMYAFGMNGETHTPATGFTERWDEATVGASWAGADRSTPTTTTISGTATASASTRVVLGIASIRPSASETTLIDWSDPLSPAPSTVLTNGISYNLYARGNDTECGTMYYGDSVAQTTADGTAQSFTWSSCTPSVGASVTIDSPLNGASLNGNVNFAVTYNLSSGAEYSIDGGAWTPIATTWDTTTVVGSDTGVIPVAITVRAYEDNCSSIITSSINVTVDNRVDTAAGVATAVASGPNSIDISMPYSADVNNSSTYDVDYKLCAAGGYTVWVSGATNTPSPYTDTITGLVSNECYDVRMTYLDLTDTVTGTAVQTVTNIYLPSNLTRLETPATAVANNATTIAVSAPYIGDLNNNNTLLIEWSNAGPTGGYPNSNAMGHAVSPYSYNITTLTEASTYNVRVTYTDGDGIVGTYGAVQTFTVTTPAAYTPSGMLHNSDTLGNNFAVAYPSGWGVPGGEYGPFTCGTCHAKSTGNIKRLRTTINASGGINSRPVVALETTYGVNGGTNPDSNEVCETCHTQTAVHKSDMSGGAVAHYGNDCISCHAHNAGFKPPTNCDSCHDVSASGTAPKMFDKSGGVFNGTAYGSHLKALNADTFDGTTDWEVQCKKCHGLHTGDVLVADNATVGISYSSHGGIWLGGTSTGGKTTEAEICWTCHDLNGISEWGTDTGANNFTDPGNDYNYGSLTGGVSNWIGAEWNSGTAKFGYKTGNILSTHTANSVDAGAPTTTADHGQANPDTVDQIRCTYCHDVHNLNAQVNDSVSGQPYLRGTWLGNPFPEDGAPQAGDTWTTGAFGAVPRGTNAANQQGGYQINQNNPTAMTGFTVANSSGLCELCHGNGDGTFDSAEIDILNEFGTASTDWVGTNGHSATALGGGESVAANIFTVGDRNTTAPSFASNNGNGTDAGNPAMANTQQLLSDAEVYSFRDLEGDGWTLSPQVIDDRQNIVQTYNWGADTNSALDPNYHEFSCSKCHNPHASRLPRLMITNCLDTNHNTWDDQASVDTIPAQGTTNTDGSGSVSADNANVTFSNATSAQNCHRVKDPAFTNSKGTGWNYVTPW